MSRLPKKRTALAMALACAAACASTPPRPAQPLPAEEADPGPVQHAVATTYDTLEHPPKAPGTLVERWIDEQVRHLARANPGTPISRDRRLDGVATDLARSPLAEDRPSADRVAQVMAHHGFPMPTPAFLFFRGSATLDQASLAPLRKQLSDLLSQGSFRRYGQGFARKGEVMMGIFVASELSLEFTPIPKRLGLGQSATIAGRVLPPFTQPELLVTTPRGTVEHLARNARGARFAGTLPCQNKPGIYRVEIMGTNAGGPTVLANFPIYCGLALPEKVDSSRVASKTERRASEVEDRLFALLNETRIQLGLSPFRRSDELSKVARAYSQELADYREVSHLSPRTGSVLDRVRRAGIARRPTMLAENVARVYSATEAHEGFLGSPGHRANMVHPRLSEVGIGVVADPGGDGPRAFYVTEIFAAFKP